MHLFSRTAFAFLALAPLTGSFAAAQTATQVSPSTYSISGWRVECSSQNNALSCQVLDQVLARANNAVLTGVSVRQYGTARTPVMVVQVPLGVAVDQPMRIAFGPGTETTVPFVTCYANGCFARAPLNEAMLARLRTDKSALTISYVNLDANLNKQTITITLPTDGFAVAYEKLK